MNRSNNERFQATEHKIIDAFIQLLSQKTASAITVSEICRLGGIHRTSFYLHFHDVYELMDQIEVRLAKYYAGLFTGHAECYNIGQKFEQLFAFIYTHQNFYRAYWHRSRDLHVLDVALSPETEANMKKTASDYGVQSETELEFHRAFFRAGLAALIGYWLSRGCRETPAEFGKILEREYLRKTYSCNA